MNFNVISFTSQKVTEFNVLNLFKKKRHLYGKDFLLKSFTSEVEKTSNLRYLFEFQRRKQILSPALGYCILNV